MVVVSVGKDKSRRNAELVLYPEQLQRMIDVLESGWVKKWAWILHDKDLKKDGTKKEPHIHLMCSWERKTTKDSVIANKFGCRLNQIENIKGTWGDALAYLTHANAPDKYQYDNEAVKSNFDWENDIQKSSSRQRKKIDDVISGIGDGTIREYNLHDNVTVLEYTKYRRMIEDAFRWRKGYVQAHLEELVEMKQIIWVYGQTGTGKTTFAKQLAKTMKVMFAITSTGKNMFDEYRDEPCLIIDDLRPADMRFSDLLGILDPYNFRAAQARYQNKALQTKVIIVTTTHSPEEFCRESNREMIREEDERQLYRRIDKVYECTTEYVREYEYDEENKTRNITNTWQNWWLMVKKRKQRKSEATNAVNRMAEEMFAEMA